VQKHRLKVALRVLWRFDGKGATLASRNDNPQDFPFSERIDASAERLAAAAAS
jgi:hypothetical protein